MSDDASSNLRRVAALVLPCIATVVAALGIAWWFRTELRREATRNVAIEREVMPSLDRWAAGAEPGSVRGVFFGDSLTMSLDSIARGGPKGGVPVLVEEALRAAGTPVDILALTHAAFRPVHFAYVLDEILAGRPRFVVVEINLRLLATTSTTPPVLRFLPMSRRLSLRRQLELAPFLRGEGIGAFHPDVYRLQEALSLLYVMDGVRIVGHDWLQAQSVRVEHMLGLERSVHGVHANEANSDAAAYASSFAESPSAAILRLLDEDLAGAGAWTLYYVSPINPDGLKAAGVTDQDALAARIDGLRAASQIPPERWLDLHAGFPASAFLDQMNHLRPSALRTVSAKVLRKLRPVIAGRDQATARP